MARGEPPTSSANAPGMAFVALFGVMALGAVLFVIVTTNACRSCTQALVAPAPGFSDPYAGASAAAAMLGWRDTMRIRAMYGAPLTHDGAAAHLALEPTLRSRGLVVDGASAAIPVTLPGEVTVPSLDRVCGVIEIQADGTSVISAAGEGMALRTADDPSVIAIGACGTGPYRVEGVGTATARAYLVPGLVTGDVERTALPEDVLVAHAEAEVALGVVGYTASDQIVRIEVTSTATVQTLTGLPSPAVGCVPWVVVVVGAGRSRALLPTPIPDFATERALSLAVTCASSSGATIELEDAGGDGFIAWARPYSATSGAVVAPTATVSVAGAHVVDASMITLPPPFPEATP